MQKLFTSHINSITGFNVLPEYTFMKGRRWRIDYAIVDQKIAIEVEGGIYKKTTYIDKKTGQPVTWIGGRHNTSKGFKADIEKYNNLAAEGWLILRTTPQEMFSVEFTTIVTKCLKNRIFTQKTLP